MKTGFFFKSKDVQKSNSPSGQPGQHVGPCDVYRLKGFHSEHDGVPGAQREKPWKAAWKTRMWYEVLLYQCSAVVIKWLLVLVWKGNPKTGSWWFFFVTLLPFPPLLLLVSPGANRDEVHERKQVASKDLCAGIFTQDLPTSSFQQVLSLVVFKSIVGVPKNTNNDLG